MFANILVATDGSELAERAVTRALDLAKSLRAGLTVVTVTQSFPTGDSILLPRPSDVDFYETTAAKAARLILERVAMAAAQLGVPCRQVHRVDEKPAEGILAACREHGCDMIVIATHGRRGMERLLLGSQAAEIVTMSPVPVLVCR